MTRVKGLVLGVPLTGLRHALTFALRPGDDIATKGMLRMCRRLGGLSESTSEFHRGECSLLLTKGGYYSRKYCQVPSLWMA